MQTSTTIECMMEYIPLLKWIRSLASGYHQATGSDPEIDEIWLLGPISDKPVN